MIPRKGARYLIDGPFARGYLVPADARRLMQAECAPGYGACRVLKDAATRV
jgi:hypothetical protein